MEAACIRQRVFSIPASIDIKLQSYALHFFSVLSLFCVLAVLLAVVFCRHFGSLRRLTHGYLRRDTCDVSRVFVLHVTFLCDFRNV